MQCFWLIIDPHRYTHKQRLHRYRNIRQLVSAGANVHCWPVLQSHDDSTVESCCTSLTSQSIHHRALLSPVAVADVASSVDRPIAGSLQRGKGEPRDVTCCIDVTGVTHCGTATTAPGTESICLSAGIMALCCTIVWLTNWPN